MTSFQPEVLQRILSKLQITLTGDIYEVIESALKEQEVLDDLMKRIRTEAVNIQITSHDPVVSEFKKMIGDPSTTERDMQKLIEKNCWLLSPTYEKVEPQKKAGASHILDFRILGGLNRCQIVELKRPNDKLFKDKDKEMTKSRKLVRALEQLIDYREYYIKHHDYVLSTEGIKFYKPWGTLIMGRTIEDEMERLEVENSYLRDIKIETYDEVLARAEALVSFSKRSGLMLGRNAIG